jgi:hypothetical protein
MGIPFPMLAQLLSGRAYCGAQERSAPWFCFPPWRGSSCGPKGQEERRRPLRNRLSKVWWRQVRNWRGQCSSELAISERVRWQFGREGDAK